MSIYYIHGFASTVNSSTLKLLQESYPAAIGLAYDYSEPGGAVTAMAAVLNADPEDKIIIGSSLGGWFAEKLTNYVVADYIFYNPQTEPETGLAKYDIDREILDKYMKEKTAFMRRQCERIVILCKDDETVDYSIAYNKYAGKSFTCLTTGGHRMTTKNMQYICGIIKTLKKTIV